MSIYDNSKKDQNLKDFYREGWDIETHPGFPLSYDIHRGRKFLALDRSKNRGWFHQAVLLQESLLCSPHEVVEKGRVKKGKISHINAQIAVKTIALARVRKNAEEIGFQPRFLDWEVGSLGDEWGIDPGRDMIRYLCLVMGGYSEDKQFDILRRMRWWGSWYLQDLIQALTGGFFEKAKEFIEKEDVFNLAKLLQEDSESAEQQFIQAGKDGGAGKKRNKGEEEDPGTPTRAPGFQTARPKNKWEWHKPKIKNDEWWAPMKVVQPPLVAKQEIIKRVYVQKNTDAGCGVNDVSRILTDGKVFRESRPAIKGTVLIDASGSMSLTDEEIYSVCANIPGATIGIYTGMHSQGYGKLVVAAINGRIIESKTLADERKGGGANMVDGPALEWLAVMPRPRVWVSDGCVTGLNEYQSEEILEDAARIQRNGHIVRIHALKEAPGVIKYLRAKRD